jgi:hypothetical protein
MVFSSSQFQDRIAFEDFIGHTETSRLENLLEYAAVYTRDFDRYFREARKAKEVATKVQYREKLGVGHRRHYRMEWVMLNVELLNDILQDSHAAALTISVDDLPVTKKGTIKRKALEKFVEKLEDKQYAEVFATKWLAPEEEVKQEPMEEEFSSSDAHSFLDRVREEEFVEPELKLIRKLRDIFTKRLT